MKTKLLFDEEILKQFSLFSSFHQSQHDAHHSRHASSATPKNLQSMREETIPFACRTPSDLCDSPRGFADKYRELNELYMSRVFEMSDDRASLRQGIVCVWCACFCNNGWLGSSIRTQLAGCEELHWRDQEP